MAVHRAKWRFFYACLLCRREGDYIDMEMRTPSLLSNQGPPESRSLFSLPWPILSSRVGRTCNAGHGGRASLKLELAAGGLTSRLRCIAIHNASAWLVPKPQARLHHGLYSLAFSLLGFLTWATISAPSDLGSNFRTRDYGMMSSISQLLTFTL